MTNQAQSQQWQQPKQQQSQRQKIIPITRIWTVQGSIMEKGNPF